MVKFLKTLLVSIALTVASFGAAPPKQTHTVIIIGENHSYSKIIGNSAAPNINYYASQYTLLTSYYANTHPSIGNYFDLTTGSVITNSDGWTGTVTIPDLVTEFTASNVSWKVYAQSIPYTGYLGGDSGYYIKHHNPFAYFQEVRKSTALAANMVGLPQLQTDINNNQLPAFSFIVPDIVHDAHNCPLGMSTCTDNQKIAAFDTFVQQQMVELMSMPDWSSTVVYIVFDEGNSTDTAYGGGHVALVVVGGQVKNAFKLTRLSQEPSLLRTVEFNTGIPTKLGASATATSFYDIWKPIL